jgi:exoribonuclease-2
LPGMPQVARGAQVKIDILRWDEVDLSIEARLLEVPASTEIAADADLDYEDDEDAPAETAAPVAELPEGDAVAAEEAVGEAPPMP